MTGNYTFWIASDDTSELYLSADDDPERKQLIARVAGFTLAREWTKYADQESALIGLQAGRRYYFEMLHKEEGGGDHVAVAWQPPGSEVRVISGPFLAPYVP